METKVKKCDDTDQQESSVRKKGKHQPCSDRQDAKVKANAYMYFVIWKSSPSIMLWTCGNIIWCMYFVKSMP